MVPVEVTHHYDVVVRNWILCHEHVRSVVFREVGNDMVSNAEALLFDVFDQRRQHNVAVCVFLDLLILEEVLFTVFELD